MTKRQKIVKKRQNRRIMTFCHFIKKEIRDKRFRFPEKKIELILKQDCDKIKSKIQEKSQ